MKQKATEQLTMELLQLYEDDCRGPFPYDGCFRLLEQAKEADGAQSYDDFIPYMDLYFSDIASHCGGVKRILKWPKERLLEAREGFSRSFFERHPEYKSLEGMITEAVTPDLYADIALHEEMRTALLDLFSRLLLESDRFDEPHQTKARGEEQKEHLVR